MKFKAGQKVGAFIIKEVAALAECAGEARILTHVKTGARVLHIANEDDNKVFCVSFRTPPENSAGLPHILEHSVLCGSLRYPLKEPFVHLMKSSLQTFLNAMTFSDKTMYPVASRNPQDFKNLMNVYLDAVFFPNITRETFLQEGWHFHVESTDAPLEYKGVVYNEMRGAYSSPDSVMSQQVQTALLRGTPYEHDSGGDPLCIPSLSYEDFVSYHKRFYHPSNSWTVLYGDLDLAETLEFIEANAFSSFSHLEAKSDIAAVASNVPLTDVSGVYSINEGDTLINKTYLGRAWHLGDVTAPANSYGLDALYSLLLGSDASPLRKALLTSGLGHDAHSYYSSDQREGILFAGVSGSDCDKSAAVSELIDSVLNKVVKDGFDPKLVESVLTRMEFRLREADFGSYPKGLVYAIEAMGTWLYDGHPLVRLAWEKPFLEMKNSILNDKLLERLIQEKLLSNKRSIEVKFAPETGLDKRRDLDLAEKLAKKRASLSSEGLQKLVEETHALVAHQDSEDSLENVAKLPVLPLSAVERKTEIIEFETRNVSGVDVFFVPAPTNGIGYLSVAFDASLLPPEDAVWLSLFSSVFTSMGTESMDYVMLTQELGIRTGGVGASISAMGRMGTSGDVNPVFAIGCKFLGTKTTTALNLLGDLCVTQNFSDESRLKDLLGAEYAAVTSFVMENGARLAMLRSFATVSQRGRYAEMANGIDYVRFVKNLVESGEAGVKKASAELARVSSQIFSRKAVGVVNFSGSESEWESFEKNFGNFLGRLNSHPVNSLTFVSPELSPKNSAMIVPSQVQYVGLSHTAFGDIGVRARIDFLGHVLRSGYLWDEVRVKGGAYGCHISYGVESGELAIVSYRDPNLMRTLNVYRGIASYVQGLPITQEALDTLKIGYMGGVDRPRTFAQKNREIWRQKLVGMTFEDMQVMRDCVLSATVEDMRSLGAVLESFVSNGSIAVVGSAAAVQKEREIFSLIEEVRV